SSRVLRFSKVGLTGLEPVTSVLSGQRSNRLSYRPLDAVPEAYRVSHRRITLQLEHPDRPPGRGRCTGGHSGRGYVCHRSWPSPWREHPRQPVGHHQPPLPQQRPDARRIPSQPRADLSGLPGEGLRTGQSVQQPEQILLSGLEGQGPPVGAASRGGQGRTIGDHSPPGGVDREPGRALAGGELEGVACLREFDPFVVGFTAVDDLQLRRIEPGGDELGHRTGSVVRGGGDIAARGDMRGVTHSELLDGAGQEGGGHRADESETAVLGGDHGRRLIGADRHDQGAVGQGRGALVPQSLIHLLQVRPWVELPDTLTVEHRCLNALLRPGIELRRVGGRTEGRAGGHGPDPRSNTGAPRKIHPSKSPTPPAPSLRSAGRAAPPRAAGAVRLRPVAGPRSTGRAPPPTQGRSVPVAPSIVAPWTNSVRQQPSRLPGWTSPSPAMATCPLSPRPLQPGASSPATSSRPWWCAVPRVSTCSPWSLGTGRSPGPSCGLC